MDNVYMNETIDILVKKVDILAEHNLNLADSLHDAHKALRKLEGCHEKLEKRISKLESMNYQKRYMPDTNNVVG